MERWNNIPFLEPGWVFPGERLRKARYRLLENLIPAWKTDDNGLVFFFRGEWNLSGAFGSTSSNFYKLYWFHLGHVPEQFRRLFLFSTQMLRNTPFLAMSVLRSSSGSRGTPRILPILHSRAVLLGYEDSRNSVKNGASPRRRQKEKNVFTKLNFCDLSEKCLDSQWINFEF